MPPVRNLALMGLFLAFFALLLCSLVSSMIIPPEAGDIGFNDYGLAEAQIVAQAEWATTSAYPEWAKEHIDISEGTDKEKKPNSLEDTDEIPLKRRGLEGDDYYDEIPPVGGNFPHGEFVPLPGLPGTLGSGLLKGSEDSEKPKAIAVGSDGQVYFGDSNVSCASARRGHVSLSTGVPFHASNSVEQFNEDQARVGSNNIARRGLPSLSLDDQTSYDHVAIANWWEVGGPQFLETYMKDWAGTDFTKEYGVFGSLAGCYGFVDNDSKPSEEECAKLWGALGENSTIPAGFAVAAARNFVAINDLLFVIIPFLEI